MLENWMWEPKVLKSLGKHYLTGEALPDDLIASVVKSKSVNQGLFSLRQCFFGKFDSTSPFSRLLDFSDRADVGIVRTVLVHTTEVNADLTTLWNDTREKTSLVSNEGTKVGGQSGFGESLFGQRWKLMGADVLTLLADDCQHTSPADTTRSVHLLSPSSLSLLADPSLASIMLNRATTATSIRKPSAPTCTKPSSRPIR